MDSLATSGRLEWWANSLTCLAAFEVSVKLTTLEDVWEATGQLARPDEASGLATVCDLDPVFDLRFPDESTITVEVTPLTPTGHFTLTEPQ